MKSFKEMLKESFITEADTKNWNEVQKEGQDLEKKLGIMVNVIHIGDAEKKYGPKFEKNKVFYSKLDKAYGFSVLKSKIEKMKKEGYVLIK